MSFTVETGGKNEFAAASVPLPMFGLRMGYAISPKCYMHFVAEAFFLDFANEVNGSSMNLELNTEYKLFNNFAIGAGVAGLGTSIEVNSDNWLGTMKDTYHAVTLFGAFYF